MWQRAFSVAHKGPEHWLNLGFAYAACAGQRWLGFWSDEAISERAFLRQLQQGSLGRAAAAHTLRTRTSPWLGALPADVIAHLQPEARARTLAAADAICAGEFTFRGQATVRFSEDIDWFLQPEGNVDWRWELNRHVYFVTLGRAYAYSQELRYLAAFRRLLLHWLRGNPPQVGAPNWASVLEVAYRANVWTWAFQHFREALDDDALLALGRGLWLHGRFLAANLEFASPNNHLWLESKALAQLGLLFPEFRAASQWRALGLRVLAREVARQVSADGVHWEQSTLYHRLLASELCELLAALEAAGARAPAVLRETLARMLRFEAALLKPDGEPPLIGDSTVTDSYLRFNARLAGAVLLGQPELAGGELDEATLWLLGPQRATEVLAASSTQPQLRSQAFSEGGYAILRAQDRHLILDCGPFGYSLAPGHGHADALSIEVFAEGRTWLADAGVYSYHLGPVWRSFFRSTAAHNTVVVDNRDQSELLGDWHVVQPARARLADWLSTDAFDYADASHDGYLRLAQPVRHRRQVVFVKPDYWIILDHLQGQGQHMCHLYFHAGANVQVAPDPATPAVRLFDVDGRSFWLWPAQLQEAALEIVCGSLDPIQGWISRHSGEKQAAPVARYTLTATLPVCFVTVLLPLSPVNQQPPGVERFDVSSATSLLAEQEAIGVRLVTADWRDDLVVDVRSTPGLKRWDGFASEARLARIRQSTQPFAETRLEALAGAVWRDEVRSVHPPDQNRERTLA